MELIYPFIIAFLFVFVSELGDKTQLLVLSFSTKVRTRSILLGVALGSLLSHGTAILFGSSLHILGDESFHSILQIITYISFIVFGILSLIPKQEKESSNKKNLLSFLSNLKLNYSFLIALSIVIGELGDKTFLASIGLGLQYPYAKIFLVLGAILAMLASDYIAIVFGRLLSKKISEKTLNLISGILFLIFGIFHLIRFIV